MSTEIIMPKAGMDMEEGTVIKWLKNEGDKVETGEPILEILTDKVNMEVEAEESGVLLKKIADEGAVLPVFTVIGYIGEEGEKISDTKQPDKVNENAKDVGNTDGDTKEELSSDFDVVVLGAGPGGYVAAIRAAQLGAKVAIVEKQYFGGTCLNVGCIPTKTLVKNAEILHYIKKAGKRGIKVGKPEVDMEATIKMKEGVVSQLVNGVQGLLKSNGVKAYVGEGEVSLDKTISIVSGKDKGQSFSFDKLIIATGSSAFIPPVPGLDLEGIMTSTEILNLKEIPKHLVIIGGGVIGCEFATVFNAFGSKVTIVEMLPRLVPNMDKDVSSVLLKSLKSSGIDVMLDCKVEKVESKGNKYEVYVSGSNSGNLLADKVLVSVGRKPNLGGLNKLNLEMDRNSIKINNKLETSVKDIYAIGDVTGKILLAHVASAQGIKAAENAMGKDKEMDYRFVPSCIYTIPEIGSVGLTEEQAKEQYDNVIVGKFPLVASGKALAMGETEGFAKIITEKKYGEILGVHIIGPNATELIAEATAFMRLEGTIEELIDTIHAHPTISESIMEAGHDALGEAIHLPKK